MVPAVGVIVPVVAGIAALHPTYVSAKLLEEQAPVDVYHCISGLDNPPPADETFITKLPPLAGTVYEYQ